METLKKYIESRYSGSQVAFAKAQKKPTSKQQVNEWIRHGGYYVADGRLFIYKRDLN